MEGTPDGGDVGQGIAGAGKQGENCLFLKLNDFFSQDLMATTAEVMKVLKEEVVGMEAHLMMLVMVEGVLGMMEDLLVVEMTEIVVVGAHLVIVIMVVMEDLLVGVHLVVIEDLLVVQHHRHQHRHHPHLHLHRHQDQHQCFHFPLATQQG